MSNAADVARAAEDLEFEATHAAGLLKELQEEIESKDTEISMLEDSIAELQQQLVDERLEHKEEMAKNDA